MIKSKVIAELRVIKQRCQDTTHIETEEATKHSLILPLLRALGYDVFDNNEVRPEYVADIGTKKGEKVDYVILQNGQPVILIEAKQVGIPLKNKVDQLFRYFSVTSAKIGILTDGVKYLFFTDSQKANIMDTEPYMAIDFKTATDEELTRLLAYHKDQMDIGDVLGNIKYDLFTEVSKKFVDNLIDMRPDNWIIRKLAEECQIAEPDDGKLAEILNNQVAMRVGKPNKKIASKPEKVTKSNSKIVTETVKNDVFAPLANTTENRLVITDNIFKNTKGIKIKAFIINGEKLEIEKPSWRDIFKYVFTESSKNLSSDEIYDLYNMGNSRAYVYRTNCSEDIKNRSIYLEDKELYLYINLCGAAVVKRTISACDIFGKIDKNTVEIEYETEN